MRKRARVLAKLNSRPGFVSVSAAGKAVLKVSKVSVRSTRTSETFAKRFLS